ncbi:LacI family DNA-binding transcriptional regulator [Devosia sp. D6-9]|nr:LacI family DNA-binding transcriptional regulator [Devosia sp. D6-9]
MAEQKTAKTFVTAEQVAKLAGVSRSAVSRTFTSGASVSESTRKKVIEAADRLGYHVNHLARGLIHDRSGIVCLIGADLNTPYHARILASVTSRLQAIDRVAMIINTSGETESVESALRLTLNYRADATVVLSGSPAASLIDTCVANGQHVILINRDVGAEGVDAIAVDNATAAHEAFAMFQRAGCRKIAVVSSQAGTPSLVGRERPFAAAAAAAGIEVKIVRPGPTSYASGVEAARILLPRSDRPDAAFCVTDLLACGFMDAARNEFGMEIPRDLCVIGFDDIEQAGWGAYNLTTFRQPVDRIADAIVELVDKKGEPSAPLVLQADPIWRKSVRPR